MLRTTRARKSNEQRPVVSEVEIRPMRPDDIDDLLHIQRQCYPPMMQEKRDVLASRIASSGTTSRLALLGSVPIAYLFSYPSVLSKVTPLDAAFVVAAMPDTFYMHDLAVSPQAKGRGVGKALIRDAFAMARRMQLAQLALVAVQGAHAYWQTHGFSPVPQLSEAMDLTLAGYPGDAQYMVCSLA